MSGMFRPLEAEDIEIRVAQVTQKGVSLLLYKTARTDANLLDEVVGENGWQNDFRVIDGVLFGGIGIRANGEWVWKWDCGTESNTEKEKGEASDAFKRAGFKWGIGRELYTAPFVWIDSGKCEINQNSRTNKLETKDRFRVAEISYEGGKITNLTIENITKGCAVFWYSRPGSKPVIKSPDDEPWEPQTKARKPEYITAKQKDEIANRMRERFHTNPYRGSIFARLTGYDPRRMDKIPRSAFDAVMQAIDLSDEQVIVEIEKQKELDGEGKTA